MQDTDEKIRELVEGYAGVGDNEEDRAPAHADAITDQRRADRQPPVPLPVAQPLPPSPLPTGGWSSVLTMRGPRSPIRNTPLGCR